MRQPTKKLAAMAALLVIGAGGLAYMRAGDPAPAAKATVQLRPDDAALVARGREVYRDHCASCHGANLEGQGDWQRRRADGVLPAPPHDSSGHTWHHADAVLFELTKHGPSRVLGDPSYRSEMPSFEGRLRDHDIIAALSFIKSTWPQAIRDRHDLINEKAPRR